MVVDVISVKLKDQEFVHAPTAGNCHSTSFESKKLEWYRGNEYKDITVFTDRMFTLVDQCDSKYKIAWLCEPKAINPNSYEYIKHNYHKFDFVFTMDEDLLKLDKKFILTLWGGCWINHKDCGIHHSKSKKMSIIASNKTMTEGHRLRQVVVSHFRNEIGVDMYGRGFNALENKIDGLKEYEFSIVIENSRPKNYVSEKIIDCFVLGTVPIYWGASNICEFFDPEGIILFDTMEDLINIHHNIISNNIKYDDYRTAIKKNFELSQKYVCTEDLLYNNLKRLNIC